MRLGGAARPAAAPAGVGGGGLPAALQRGLYAVLWGLFLVRGCAARARAWAGAWARWAAGAGWAGAPAHVAVGGAVGGCARAVARLALAAESAGAQRFSVCARGAVAIEKAVAAAGVRIPVVVRAPGPRALLVRAARALAAAAPRKRACDARSAQAVAAHLDALHAEHALPSEPDVLVLVPPPGGAAVCSASFSVWQLRLTQFRFARSPLADLADDEFLDLVCSATNVAKRFGR